MAIAFTRTGWLVLWILLKMSLLGENSAEGLIVFTSFSKHLFSILFILAISVSVKSTILNAVEMQ